MRGYPRSDVKKIIVTILFILVFVLFVYENETVSRFKPFPKEILMEEILSQNIKDDFETRRKHLEKVCTTYQVSNLGFLNVFYLSVNWRFNRSKYD